MFALKNIYVPQACIASIGSKESLKGSEITQTIAGLWKGKTMVSLIINFLNSNNKTGGEFTCHMRKLFFA